MRRSHAHAGRVGARVPRGSRRSRRGGATAAVLVGTLAGTLAGTVALLAGPVASAVGAVRSLQVRSAPLVLVAASPPAPGLVAPGGALDGVGLPALERQTAPNDCGPAALATVLAWRGRPAGLASVRDAARLRADGASLAEMVRLAADFELPGAWYRVPPTALAALPTPFLAHLTSDGGHYVAVRWVGRGFVLLADPARGWVLERASRFQRTWRGRVLLFDAAVAAARSGPS